MSGSGLPSTAAPPSSSLSSYNPTLATYDLAPPVQQSFAAPPLSVVAGSLAPPSDTSSALPLSASSSKASGSGVKVELSFHGILDSTLDALLLFEGSRRGVIPRVKKRLVEEQREDLIKSGSIFIFEEEESGIKRWTDGLIWSPSRILGNYLVYRQTEQRNSRAPRGGSASKAGKKSAKTPLTPPSPSSDLKRPSPPPRPAAAQVKKEPLVRPPPPGGSKRSFSSTPAGLDPSSLLGLSALPKTEPNLQTLYPSARVARRKQREDSDVLMEESDDEHDLEELIRLKERSLVGSLTNSYAFKEGGLVKRTMSMLINGKTQHLVSYYTLSDGMNDRLTTPSSLAQFADYQIDPQLLAKSQFRFPPVVDAGADGILRYVSEADNSQQSPDPESPPALPKEVAPVPQPIPHPHPYYSHQHQMSSSYPTLGMSPPLPDTTYSSTLQFPGYSLNPPTSSSMTVKYGPQSTYNTYSPAVVPSTHQWSSSLPKEFHHPAAAASPHSNASIDSPFGPYNPLPPPPSANANWPNSVGPGPQRRRRTSQASIAALSVPENRQQPPTGLPFSPSSRPLVGGPSAKPAFHPYAMPSPTDGWTVYHPSSNKSPSATASNRSSYFEGEPSVFAGGPLSGAIVSAPSSAGSSLSAGSGGGSAGPPGHALTLPGGLPASVGTAKRLSLNLPRDGRNFNSPRNRRSPSIQPSPLRTAAALPFPPDDSTQQQQRSSTYPYAPFAQQPQQQQPPLHHYDSPAMYGSVAPHDPLAPGGMSDQAKQPPYSPWMAPPGPPLPHAPAPHDPQHFRPLSHSYYYDPSSHIPQEQQQLPHLLQPSLFDPNAMHQDAPAPAPPSSSFVNPSLVLNPTTTFAEDKRSATLALDQLQFGEPTSSLSGGDLHNRSSPDRTAAHEYQVPSGLVAADDGRSLLANFSIQPPLHSQHEEPAHQYWSS